jgi:ankyrin repeat protein
MTLTSNAQVESEYTAPTKPFTIHDEAYYTNGLKDGSYEFWTASRDYQMAKRTNEKEWENYEKAIKDHKEDGYKEKKAAIDKLTRELQQLEASLIAAGAKTFKQLYPNIPEPQENRNNNNRYEQPKPTPYATELSFQVPDLNPIKKKGYVRLFEAAWNDDLETLKSLTLVPWEHEAGKPLATPLQIAVKDGSGFSPFSIAVLRGHEDLASKIIGIASAQLGDGDERKPRQRWTLNPGDSNAEGYSDEDDDDSGVLPIYNELVNDKYTIDNLGQVSEAVKSSVAPLTMIEWPCYTRRFLDPSKENDHQYTILGHAVVMDDMELFKYIIQLGAEQQALLAEEDDDQKYYTIHRDIFYKAIKHGRTAMLAEMVCSPSIL